MKLGTDPLDDDTDNDTYLDGIEVLAETDPLDPSDYPGSGALIVEVWILVAIGASIAGVTVVVALLLKKGWLLQRLRPPASSPSG